MAQSAGDSGQVRLNALAQDVSDRMSRNGWSTHEVSRRAQRAGFPLSERTVQNTITNTSPYIRLPEERTILGLAAAFDLPPVYFRTLALRSMGMDLAESNLSGDEQVVLLLMKPLSAERQNALAEIVLQVIRGWPGG